MREGCLLCTMGNSKYVRYNGFIPRIHHQMQAPKSYTSTSTCFILHGITGKKHDQVYSSFVERIKKKKNVNYRKRKMHVIACVCISIFTYINIYLFFYFTVDNPEKKYHFNTSKLLCYLDPQALSFLNSTQLHEKIRKLCDKQYLFGFFQKHLRRICFK